MPVRCFSVRAALATLLLLLGACAAPSQSTRSDASNVRIERTDKTFALDPGVTRVALDNPWGELNVRGHDRHEVGIHAVVQRLPPDFAALEFRSHRDGDTLRIEVLFAGAGKTPPGRIDVALYVPNEIALALHTRSGRIAAKKRLGAVEANTQSGDIGVSSRGRLNLHTQSGRVRAMAIGARWQGSSEISSDSGQIILLVPTFGDITLSAQTGGALSSDFGLSVHANENGSRHAGARYGRGTSPLRVHSRSGEVVLAQLVLLGEDAANPENDD